MLIVNGNIYTMAGPVIERGFVRTRGSRIESVGTMEELEIINKNKDRKKGRNEIGK